jgi:hypothetical protein
VQRLVIVCFRLRDVVVKLAGDRFPFVMNERQHCVTIIHAIDQHSHGANVVEVVEGQIFRLHFAMDRPDVFRSPRNLGFDVEPG